jgi:hypothetical protein
MKKWYYLGVILAILLGVIITHADPDYFRIKTPLGINIVYPQDAVFQYEEYWGLDWDKVEWQKIDRIFLTFEEFYKAKVNPKKVTVFIYPFDLTCPDSQKEFPGDIEMRVGESCWDGYYSPTSKTAHLTAIHLGEDSAQGHNAFCNTALGWEMHRVFLRNMKNKCWMGDTVKFFKKYKCDKWFPSEWNWPELCIK